MRWTLRFALTLALILGTTLPATAGGVSAQDTFDQLATLAGTWTGSAEGEGEEAAAAAEEVGEIRHEFRVSAAGTVVMETMDPGGPHEMINMYHLDGEDLVLTHYCAGGNQPTMKLNREESTTANLVFDFTGGTNLDPATDPHIHSANLQIDGDEMESMWYSYAGGEPAATMVFHLSRSK
jgi:hypothetical protein